MTMSMLMQKDEQPNTPALVLCLEAYKDFGSVPADLAEDSMAALLKSDQVSERDVKRKQGKHFQGFTNAGHFIISNYHLQLQVRGVQILRALKALGPDISLPSFLIEQIFHHFHKKVDVSGRGGRREENKIYI